MAKKEKKDWSKAGLKELIEASDKMEKQRTDLMLRHSQGKLKNTAQLVKVRKEIARINTFLNQKAQTIKDE